VMKQVQRPARAAGGGIRRQSGQRRQRGMNARLIALHTHAAKLASDTSENEVVRDTLRAMSDALGYDLGGCALLVDGKLRATMRNRGGRRHVALSIHGPGIVSKTFNMKRPLSVPDVRKDPSYLEMRKGIRSELAVPVILRNKAIGVLNVESKSVEAFNSDDKRLLETLASYVASCLGRLRGEQAERLSQVRMRGLLNALPDLVFDLDSKGNYTGFFASNTNDLAVPPEKFLGKPYGSVFPRDVARRAASALRSVRRTHRVGKIEYQLPTLDGRTAHWETFISPTSLGGFVVVARNVTSRKKAEARLRLSEAAYRSLVDGLLDGTYRSTHGGRLIDVNPAFVKMFGYSTKKELLDIPNVSRVLYFSPDDRASAFLDTGQERVEVYRMRRKDGTEIWVEDHGRYVHDENGKVVLHEGVLRDVTERVHAEEALRQSEIRNRELVDGMLDGTYRSTHAGRFIDVNPAFVRMFGYSSKQEVLDIPDIKEELYFSPEERGSHILDTGQQEVEVYRMRKKDGSEIWVEDHGRYVHDENGKVIYHEGVLRDVTARVHAEEALRQSEARYRDLVELSPIAIAVHNGEKLLYINPEGAKIMGIEDRTKIVGSDLSKFVHPESQKALADRPGMMIKEGKKAPLVEARLLKTDGTIVDVEIAGMPVSWQGAPAAQVVFQDITQRKIMTNELKLYSDHLEELVKERTEKLKEAERLAAMGQLAAMVAHDLRNPLTGITGATYYLKKKYGATADERTKEMLEIIEKDVEYSNKMMTSLVEYSGEVRLNLRETDLRSIVEQALTLVRIPDEVRVSDFAEAGPKLMLDEEKMVRVAVNVIYNAVEAMPQKGELTIKSRETGGNIDLSFSDTGAGMTEEVLSRIWTPFSTTKAKGMGLGLPMSKQIVEAHGGSISVKSRPGKGTTVTVTIPIKVEPKEGAP